MGKVIILTHGELAKSLYESTGMFIADRTGLEALGLGIDIEAFRTSLRKTLLEDAEQDFLILADLFGGTPFNIAASLISEVKEQGKKMEVITGVNLPMLLEIVPLISEMSCQELKKIALEVGTEGIRDLIAELSR
ncbi:MAG TPA: PTS fructose transporter subunit IIA [Candidatus Agathobaculum pullicola]|nr:PTS fructose transporter subunit IIA [Candidatus Agathobaculum pullicola]